MSYQLRYGESSFLNLEAAPQWLVADCQQLASPLTGDLTEQVRAALDQPLGYPPLRDNVVPGDRIVVALDVDVPRRGELVAGIVETFLSAGIDAHDITILQSREGVATPSLAAMLASREASVQTALHDPNDRSQLAYLAASEEAQPIMLNRLLCEADFVLPVSLLRPESALGYAGPHGGLCTSFSDAGTLERFRSPLFTLGPKQQQQRRAEADEVAWWLGIQFTLQIVAGPGDSIRCLLAGQTDEVYRSGRKAVDTAWSYQVPRKAQLVVATIEGNCDEQNWANFGRALHAARMVCAEQGTIILCTELTCDLGRSLSRLSGYESNERLLKRVRRDRSEDALSACLLLEMRESMHVYLLSGLDSAVVEAIGIGYVDVPQHIARLSRQFDSCILLPNAHRATARVGKRS